MTDVINFYKVRGPFGCFSNFSPHPITIDDVEWPTTEHYFQAQKFAGTTHEALVRNARTPREAAEMGRDRGRPLRSDWERVKNEVMLRALAAKFTQHFGLSQVLLWTGNARLVEHTKNDSYWGDGGDGSGVNMLGILLMRVRQKLMDGEIFPVNTDLRSNREHSIVTRLEF